MRILLGWKDVMSSALETVRRDFGGEIIEPGGPGYESASRSVLTSGSPAYVLRPASVGDVQAAVRFAADAGLVLSVRGGGHGFPGFGTNDGGVVIDLSNLATVEIIDDERHRVRIGGGATWGPVAAALAPHGLAISSGDTKSVGVGGLTLTGGIGWKVRKYGLVALHRRPQRRRCGIPGPRRRHRLRASPGGVDVRDHHRGPGAGRRGRSSGPGRDLGEARASRQRRLRELPHGG